MHDILHKSGLISDFLTVKQWKPTVPPFDFIAKIAAEPLMREKSYSTSNEFVNLSNKRGFELLLPFSLFGMF